MTSQCSTIFPFWTRKTSTIATPRSPGAGVTCTCRKTRSPSAAERTISHFGSGNLRIRPSRKAIAACRVPPAISALCSTKSGVAYFSNASFGIEFNKRQFVKLKNSGLRVFRVRHVLLRQRATSGNRSARLLDGNRRSYFSELLTVGQVRSRAGYRFVEGWRRRTRAPTCSRTSRISGGGSTHMVRYVFRKASHHPSRQTCTTRSSSASMASPSGARRAYPWLPTASCDQCKMYRQMATNLPKRQAANTHGNRSYGGCSILTLRSAGK